MSEPSPASQPEPRLLTRLNRRGFRLVMLLDGLAVLGLMVGSMLVRFGWQAPPPYTPEQYALSFAVSALIFLVAFYFGGLYEREPRLGAAGVLAHAARLSLAAGSFVALLNLLLSGFARQRGSSLTERVLPFPIGNLLVVIVLAAVVVAVNRTVVHWLRTRREGPPRVLLAGTRQDIELARDHVVVNGSVLRVVAEVDDPHTIVEVAERTNATDVLLLSSAWLDLWYPRTIGRLDRLDVTVLLRVGGRETLFGLDRLREVAGLPFVLLLPQTMAASQRHFKRLLDLLLVVVTAPVWLLLLGVVALHQLAVVGRPLLFRQTRVGAGGETFEMVKFRTMRTDAEAAGVQLSAHGDPRVIPACRWVRATRADELPQILHILTGRMSVVGPRPERPELTAGFEQEIAGYTRRHEVPPGLTGLAQIHGRYHTDAEYKLGYDLQYLVNWSPVLDLEIIVRTIWVVLARRV